MHRGQLDMERIESGEIFYQEFDAIINSPFLLI